MLYVFFVGFIMLSTPLDMQGLVTEGPIYKNAALQLLPGETYRYQFSTPDGTEPLTYRVLESGSCRGTLVREDETRMLLCLSKSGNLLEEGFPEMNSSFGNKSIALFSPWMLAVSDRFSWEFQTTVSAAGAKVQLPVYLKSLGRKTVAGREAYEISAFSSVGGRSTFYIDAEKRVLLSIDAGNVSARLVSAPFSLNWSGATS